VNPLGIKGVGESGIIPPAAAVAGAVEDALADYGIEIDRPPVTAPRLFELLRATGRWPRRDPTPHPGPLPKGERGEELP
jgi:hypothetical protein